MPTRTRKPSKKKSAGRPREHAIDLPIYDSMDQCASATGIPLAVLKRAKREGCMHVQHGRVHVGVFLKWFFAKLSDLEGDEDRDWAAYDKRMSAKLKEQKLETLRGQLIEFALVENFIHYLEGVCFFAELDRISAEFPSVLKGKSEVEISAECERQKGIIKKTITEAIRTWQEKKGKV